MSLLPVVPFIFLPANRDRRFGIGASSEPRWCLSRAVRPVRRGNPAFPGSNFPSPTVTRCFVDLTAGAYSAHTSVHHTSKILRLR